MPPSEGGPSPPWGRLAARLHEWSGPVYAVLDGARIPGLGAVLARRGIVARSLFLEHQDRAAVAAGPFLAALDRRQQGHVLHMPGIEAACVFWGGDVPEPVLFRHLRSINLVKIPRRPGAPPDPGGGGTETVLFRHYDPSVLAMVLPVLEPAQRARVFGPMARLVLFDTRSGQALQAAARAEWPPAHRGFLTFSAPQMGGIADTMAARSRLAVVDFLRGAAPSLTAGKTNETLLRGVRSSEASGRALGLRTELGLGRWAYLVLATRGTIARSVPARTFVTTGPDEPDVRVGQLLLSLAAELRRRGPVSGALSLFGAIGGAAVIEAVGAVVLGPVGMVIGAGVIIAVGSYECYEAYEKSKEALKDNATSEPCADCGEVGCFKVPDGADPEEFKRQLQEQQDALNKESPDDVIDRMDDFDENGRPDDSKDRARHRQQVADQARKDAYEEAVDGGKSDSQAKEIGEQAAKDALAGKDATHEIDWVAGGKGKFSPGRLGDSKINRSIGSQWNQNAPGSSLTRRDALRKAAEAAKKAGKKTLEIKLEVC